jgi:hypothetical protein
MSVTPQYNPLTLKKFSETKDQLPVTTVEYNSLITRVNALDAAIIDSTTGLLNAQLLGNVASSGQEITVLTTLTAATIVGTTAGTLGHASGVNLVAAPSSAYALQFVRAIAIYDYATAAYTGGGNDTSIRLGSGGAAITGVVTSANLLGAAGDKIVRFEPLATAALPVSVGVAISINSTTAWTQPGTAAGVCRIYTTYRVITTGL